MKSNCIFYALSRWMAKKPAGEEEYLVLRRSRVPGGVLHLLHGTLDPLTGQIAVTSFKPPPAHVKPRRFVPFFEGTVVSGDSATKTGDLS